MAGNKKKPDFHEKVHADMDYHTYRRRAAARGNPNPMTRQEFKKARKKDPSMESSVIRRAKEAREKKRK